MAFRYIVDRGDLRGAPDPLRGGRVEISSRVKPDSEIPSARALRLPECPELSSDRRSRRASSLWPHANVLRPLRLHAIFPRETISSGQAEGAVF